MALGKSPTVRRTIFGQWESGKQRYDHANVYPQGSTSEDWERWRGWIKNHIQYDDKGELINMRTLTIELRFDSDEEGRHDALKDAAMQAAKHLFTQALLISTKRKPQIAMYTSDMFAGQQEIELAPDLTELAG